MMDNRYHRTIAQMEAARATEPVFGKGITVASGFDLGAKSPLDTRTIVHTLAERDGHVLGNRAYEGMLVYVEEDKKTYQYVNGAWEEFGFSDTKFQENIQPILQKNIEQDNRLQTLEGLVVGGEGEGLAAVIQDVATNKADIALLKTDTTDLKTRMTAAEGTISTNTAAIGAEVTARQNAIAAVNANIVTIETEIANINSDLDAFSEELGSIDTAIGTKANYADLVAESMRAIEAEAGITGRLATIEGTGAGSISKALVDAKAYTDTEVAKAKTTLTTTITGIDTRLGAAEAGLALVDGKITDAHTNSKAYTDAEVAKVSSRVDAIQSDYEVADAATLAEAKMYTDTEVDTALSEANIYTDNRIGAVVGAAPEALDTLYEIANALQTNQASIADIFAQIGLKANKTYVDAELLKKANLTYVDTELAKKATKVEVNDLNTAVTAIDADLDLEITAREQAVAGLTTTVTTVDGKVTALESKSGDFVPLLSMVEPTGYGTGHVWLEYK